MSDFFEKNKKHIFFVLILIGAYLAIQYLVPLFLPLVLAFLVIAPLNPFLEKVYRKTRMGKGFLAGIILLIICTVVGILGWILVCFAIQQIEFFIKNIDFYEEQFTCFVRDCSHMVEERIGMNAGQIETLILERVDIFIEDMQVQILPNFMNQSILYLKIGVEAITFLVVTVIAAILLAKDFGTMNDHIAKVKYYEDVKQIIMKIGRLIGSFFKAQFIILIVIALICIGGLFLGNIKHYMLIGVITGILDVLPFVGTGIVLLPLAIWQLLNGKIISGIILSITFIVSALARELLEPKLIGEKMGVFPIGILIAVYAGVKVFGLLGVFLGPLYMLILCECYRRFYGEEK